MFNFKFIRFNFVRSAVHIFFKKFFYVSPIPNFLLICFPSSTCTDSVLRVSHKFSYRYINCYLQIYVIRLSLISTYFYIFLIYGKFQNENQYVITNLFFLIIKKKCQSVITQTNRVTHSPKLYYAEKNIQQLLTFSSIAGIKRD